MDTTMRNQNPERAFCGSEFGAQAGSVTAQDVPRICVSDGSSGSTEDGKDYIPSFDAPSACYLTSCSLVKEVQPSSAASMSKRRLASNKPILHCQVQLPVRPALLRRLSSQLSSRSGATTPTSGTLNFFLSRMNAACSPPITPSEQIIHTPLQPPAIKPVHNNRSTAKTHVPNSPAIGGDTSPCPSPVPDSDSSSPHTTNTSHFGTSVLYQLPTEITVSQPGYSNGSSTMDKSHARHTRRLSPPRRLSYSCAMDAPSKQHKIDLNSEFYRNLDPSVIINPSMAHQRALDSPLILTHDGRKSFFR